jgi:gamma-glutamyltranspeptidase/glutathione hydrolase
MNSYSRRLSIALALLGAGLASLGLIATGCRDTSPPSVEAISAPQAKTLPAGEDPDHYIECHGGVVVSVSGPASDIGRDILKRGGNAVDAAIATAFALQVSYPLAGNIAGGGFMVIHPAPGQGEPTTIDYRECAPAAANPRMYTREESQYSQRAVAVPGTVRGLEMARRRFGTMTWSQLIQPAIAIARDGYIVDAGVAKSTNETLADAPDFAELHRVYGKPGGGPWQAGDRMVQPDLAHTLQLLADLGPNSFYTGPIAEGFLAEINRGGGFITASDLAVYRAIERKPLTTRYRGYDVYVPPPASSGGICLLEELNMMETFDVRSSSRWSAKTLHLMAEIMRRAQYDRARYIGDPAYTAIPPKLTSKDYAAQLANTIDPAKATSSESLSTAIPIAHEEQSTTHFSVIDRKGMAVANTYTLERRWGSRIVVRNMGFILNNDMRAFNLVPGITNTKGQVGTEPNVIAPGKRPISSMTPTIVAKNGRVVLLTGSPGSRAIPNNVFSIMVSMFDFGEPVETAVEAPRFSQEWFPDQISWESPDRSPEMVEGLRQLGHTVVPPAPLPFLGDAHTIWVRGPNDYVGVADHRISGKASGY